jgi:proteasome lid subunit RPN8/RPN11
VTLRIGPAETRAIYTHLRHAYPEEGCGVLIGRESAGERGVHAIVPFENRREDSRRNRYLIAPEQFLAAEKEARRVGLDVIGVFHSHPDQPPAPSAFDLEHAWPYYSYLIVSIYAGQVHDAKSWRLGEDRSRFDSEALELAPPIGATEPHGDPR